MLIRKFYVDLCQSRPSRVSGIGSSCYVNKIITGKLAMRGCMQLTWVDSWKWFTWVDNRNDWLLGNYIYTGTHSQSRKAASKCPEREGVKWPPGIRQLRNVSDK